MPVGQRANRRAPCGRALAVLVISLGVVVAVSWLLLLSQDVSFSEGSRGRLGVLHHRPVIGDHGALDTLGRLLIIATMFWGRLGAITHAGPAGTAARGSGW